MDATRLQALFGLEGKNAVVTGGSRGIGYMIAEGLLDAGCDVIISARKQSQVSEAVERLSAKGTIEAFRPTSRPTKALRISRRRLPSDGTGSTSCATTPEPRGANHSTRSRLRGGTRS